MTETTDRRGEIRDAALRVFADCGFAKATMRQIAEEAGARSPGLIYHYFESKEGLFREVVRSSPVVSLVRDPGLMERPPGKVLRALAHTFLHTFDDPDAAALMRILLSESVRNPDYVEELARNGPQVVLGFLTVYFRHQQELGTLRGFDPQSVARAFMGMLLFYVLSREVITPLAEGLPPVDDYVDHVLDLFLGGAAAGKE
ncbi:MAG: TetR/AcrR family transcriptional regulator [Acidimicrobiia bacterium]